MKTLLLLVLVTASFSSCKKCYTCSDTFGNNSSTPCFQTSKALTDYEQSHGVMCSPN